MGTSVEGAIRARLREIDAAVESLTAERERLTRALTELVGGARASPRSRSRRSGPSRTRARKGSRAPRGSNQQAILDHVAANPGATTPQIAQATGIDRAVVYSAVSRLSAAGRLVKAGREDGQVTYQIPAAA